MIMGLWTSSLTSEIHHPQQQNVRGKQCLVRSSCSVNEVPFVESQVWSLPLSEGQLLLKRGTRGLICAASVLL